MKGIETMSTFAYCPIFSVVFVAGSVEFTAFANADYGTADVMVVNAVTRGGETARSSELFRWEAKSAQSTWGLSNKQYIRNPPARMERFGTVDVAVQDHLSGTAHATGYTMVSDRDQ